MNSQKLKDLLKEDNDYIDSYLGAVSVEEFRKALVLALKEQDRDTRHACAGVVVYHDSIFDFNIDACDAYNIIMNCTEGLKGIT